VATRPRARRSRDCGARSHGGGHGFLLAALLAAVLTAGAAALPLVTPSAGVPVAPAPGQTSGAPLPISGLVVPRPTPSPAPRPIAKREAKGAEAVRQGVVPAHAAVQRAERWLATRAGVTGFAVVDSRGRLYGRASDRQFVSASVIKAMLLVQYLRTHRAVDPWTRRLLASMIEVSDNSAAQTIYRTMGDAGLLALARVAGMRHLTTCGWLFEVGITAADQARFFARLPRLLPRAHRRFALGLLSHIVSTQSWGAPAVARRHGWTVWFKGGWCGTDLGQLVHQVARLGDGRRSFSICVLTDGDPSMGYGIETIRGVTARLLELSR